MTDLAICRWMRGWRYEWVATLPPEVYDVIVDEMVKAQEHGDTDLSDLE